MVATSVVGVDRAWRCRIWTAHVGNTWLSDAGGMAYCRRHVSGE